MKTVCVLYLYQTILEYISNTFLLMLVFLAYLTLYLLCVCMLRFIIETGSGADHVALTSVDATSTIHTSAPAAQPGTGSIIISGSHVAPDTSELIKPESSSLVPAASKANNPTLSITSATGSEGYIVAVSPKKTAYSR